MRNPLSREEVIRVIEGRGAASRIPMAYHFWSPRGKIWGEHEETAEAIRDAYPQDIQTVMMSMPHPNLGHPKDPAFRWVGGVDNKKFEGASHDARVIVPDWNMLDTIIAEFPSPESIALMPDPVPPEIGLYRLGGWWFCLFERLWSIRGMTNALMDMYLYPKELHRFFRALTDFYLRIIERTKQELNTDAIFFSDDIGMQTGPFFSLDIFREFYKPYYAEIIAKAHEVGMHVWLHTCGNIELFLPDFIEIGLDVIHPIQKYTMEEQQIAKKYGDKICIWAGFDVQQIIPFGSTGEVRAEVRFLIDTYYRKDGRFMLTCGNGLTKDTKIESFEALFEESYQYGTQKAAGEVK